MKVSLTPEWEQFVEKEVQTGRYGSPSEVVRAGLQRLKTEAAVSSRSVVSSMDALEDQLLVGVRQLDRGEGVPGEIAAEELRNRARNRRRANE